MKNVSNLSTETFNLSSPQKAVNRLGIVILNWNGAGMLKKYLPSVIKNSVGDVIVADNGSTDDSLKMMGEEFPEIRTIVFNQNYGFAEGYNRALELLKDEYEYFILLNSDVEIRQDKWDEILINYMDEHPECAACQPKLLSLRKPDEFEYAGAAGGFLDKYGYPFCRGRIFNIIEKDKGQYDTITNILWATGAALFVRSKDYFTAGELDSRFFAHMEEIDFCWRLRTMGRRIVCIPQSTAYHLGGASLNYGNPRKTYLNFRNNLVMLYKNLRKEELFPILFVRFLLDVIAALKFLFTLQFAHFWAVVKANYNFYTTFKNWLPARTSIQAKRSNTKIPERKDFSILWEYYVKRRKTFDNLPTTQTS